MDEAPSSSPSLVGVAAIFLASGVALGAFGAHGLREHLESYGREIWEKAAFYHLTHSLGAILVLLLGRCWPENFSSASKIAILLLSGVLIFSGSLYLLAYTRIKWLGAVTPIGGTAFLVAWIWLATAAFSSRNGS